MTFVLITCLLQTDPVWGDCYRLSNAPTLEACQQAKASLQKIYDKPPRQVLYCLQDPRR
jgi:hypothetical protein